MVWLRRPIAILLLCAQLLTPVAYADPSSPSSSPKVETLTRQTPGLYLSHRNEPGLATSADPLAELSDEALKKFFDEHPELKDHRVVLVLPSLFAGDEVIRNVKASLVELGIEPDVEIIRRPQGMLEGVLDFFPRRQDWQKPLPAEIKTGHISVFGGEILTMSLFAYMAATKQISPTMAVLATTLDIAQQASVTYPVRAFSAYFSRQSPARQFLANFLIGATFSANYFLLMNSEDLRTAWPKFLPTVVTGGIESAIWSNTTMSVYKWEFSEANSLPLNVRRVYRSRFMLALQVMLSPFYVYSVSPFAETLIHTRLVDFNIGHLVILGAGILAALTWPLSDRIAAWTSRILAHFFRKPVCMDVYGEEAQPFQEPPSK